MSNHVALKSNLLRRHVRSLLRPFAVLGPGMALPGLALAGPTGEVVVGGSADIVRPDVNGTVVNQLTHRAAINWQTFNVDADEYVLFNQPGASSIVLNRVLGGDASHILGQMQANGQVFLLNPQGVFFTHGASLDVQGFLASTLDMNPDDFMAGDYTLARSAAAPANAQVINDGNISAGPGGYVVLAGDYTENTGIVTANAGTVALVSGNALTLDIEGDGLVSFTVDEATLSAAAGVRNAGSLIADGGRVIMTAKVASDLVATAVNNEGLVRAHAIEEHDGEIYLVGFGGDVVNSGTLDADGENANGGFVGIYGDEDVTLADGAIQTAAADANHKGGVIRAIAEDHLDFSEGNIIRATGGTAGGFVEVSGHGSLSLRGVVEMENGTLFIDPTNVRIIAGTSPPGGSPSNSVGVDFIAEQLDTNNHVMIVASSSIVADPSLTLNAPTGNGNLDLVIGSISTGGTGCTVGVCINAAPVINFMTGGTIDVSGMTINIAGNVNMRADNGNISAGDITALGVSLDVGSSNGLIDVGNINALNTVQLTAGDSIDGGTITVGQINTPGDVNIVTQDVNIAGIGQTTRVNDVTINGHGSDGVVEITDGIEANGNVTIIVTGDADPAPSITVNGAIDAGGDIMLSADGTGVSDGGYITVQSLTAGNNISVIAISGIANGAPTFTSDGGYIEVNGGVTADNNVFMQAIGGSQATSAGNITTTGNVTGGGNVTLIADANSGAGGGKISVGNISGATIDLTASGGTTTGGSISAGDIVATGGGVSIAATGGAAGEGDIQAGDIDANGAVVITAVHGDLHSFGDINAKHINAQFTPYVGGNVSVTMGNLHADGTVAGNRDVVVQLNALSSFGNGTLDIASATAENGHVFLNARGAATTGNANLIVGNVDAGEFITLQAINNVTAQNLTVTNPADFAYVQVEAGHYALGGVTAGDININGDITVSGKQNAGFGVGAFVDLNAGTGSNDIVVTGTIDATATAAAYVISPTSVNPPDIGTMSSSGSRGVVTIHAFTQNGAVDLGGISVNAVGEGIVNVSAQNIEVGDITMDIADGSFTRVSTLTGCSSTTCAITRTETMNAGGHADVFLMGTDSNGTSATFGNVNITAGDARLEVRGFVDVTGGGIAVNATGNDFEVSSTGTFDGTNIDYTQTNLGGGATVRIESADSGGAVILSGPVDLTGKGNVSLDVIADTIKVRGIKGTATAGTFVRDGVPAGEEHDGPFSRQGGGGPGITEGTLTGGGVRVSLSGYNPSPSSGHADADTVIVDGAINLAGAGNAQLEIHGTDVTVTGDIAVKSTRMQQNGTFADSFSDSGVSVVETGTVVSDWGQASVEIAGNGNMQLADIVIAGPTASGRVEGANVRVGAVSVTASGGELDYAETRVEDGVTEALEIDGPNTLTGLALRADNALQLTGDLTLNAVGVGGALLVGTTIETQNISINVTNGDYTARAQEFGATPTDFTVGNVILGIFGDTADVNGNLALTAEGEVHFGGAADVSGDFTATAGTRLRRTVSDTAQFLNRLDSEDEDADIVLPTAFAVQASNISLTTTTGAMDLNGAALDAANALTIAAGGNLSISGVNFDATTVQMTAGGNITNGGAASSIDAGALAISAGGNVVLSETALTVGTERIADVTGDAAFLALLAAEGIAAPAGGPNLSIRGQNVTLGNVGIAGDYVFIEANSLTLNGTVASTDPELLLQVAPFATDATFSLAQSTGGGGTAAYVYDGTLDAFNPATIALGTTAHTGNAAIEGAVNIGDTNLFVLTNGTVTGLDQVTSTGIVKDLATLVGGGFEIPQTDEIDTSQDIVQSLNDRYGLDDRGDDDDDGDEEGEDTDTDTDVEGDEDSLISRDTAEEEMMCR